MRAFAIAGCTAALITVVAPVLAAEFRHQHMEPAVLVNPWNAAVFWGNYVDEAAEIMARKVYPTWQHIAQTEVIRSHAYKVFEDAFLNYNPELGTLKPDFTPIKPTK
jgi:hypothetical protein